MGLHGLIGGYISLTITFSLQRSGRLTAIFFSFLAVLFPVAPTRLFLQCAAWSRFLQSCVSFLIRMLHTSLFFFNWRNPDLNQLDHYFEDNAEAICTFSGLIFQYTLVRAICRLHAVITENLSCRELWGLSLLQLAAIKMKPNSIYLSVYIWHWTCWTIWHNSI
jgi:hypothetical protein